MYLVGSHLIYSGAININPNSSQTINVNFVAPYDGKIKLLFFPTGPVTASLTATDTATNTSFTINVNSGNSVYGEYEMDIGRLIQINSITLTNNNSSSVGGYLIVIYEVG